MSKRIILEVPDKTKGGTITILVEQSDRSLSLKTRGIETKDIFDGSVIKVDIEEVKHEQ